MSKEIDRKLVKILIIVAATATSLFSVVYAQVKANQAARNADKARMQTELAMVETARADKLSEQAQRAAAEARMNEAEALKVQQLLEECKNEN